MKLILVFLIFFNLGWSISNYNDDLERLHQQELRNQTLVNSIKIQPIKIKNGSIRKSNRSIAGVKRHK